VPGLEHVPPFEHVGVQIATSSFYLHVNTLENVNIRIVHRVPLHPVAQVHVPGLEHVPPFEHTGVQTAKGNGMF